MWWKSKAQKERDEIAKNNRKLAENQSGSLLQAFLDYVKQKEDHYRLKLWVKMNEPGKMSFHCKFEGEKEFHFNLATGVALAAQDDPKTLIDRLYQNARLNHVISEFKRMQEVEKEIERQKGQVVKARNTLRKTPDEALVTEVKRLEQKLYANIKERDSYMKTLWVNAPYMADRLHAIYRAFQLHESRKVADPVEADLTAILDDESLSAQTKERAHQLMLKYRQQKEVDAAKVEQKEQEALLILSTIEQYYVKEGEVS